MLLGKPGIIKGNPQLARFVTGAPLPDAFKTGAPKREPKKKSRGEQEMQAILEAYLRRGEIASFGFEEITLHIGVEEDICRYTPDFHVITRESRLRFIEIKGGKKWDDALVKYKVAKKQFPAFEFQMFELASGGWKQLY